MGELLLAAPDLKADGVSARGLPVVSGTVRLTPIIALLVVEIDPDHGFAPRMIEFRDRALRIPYFTYETLEFTEIDGIWIPVRGRIATRRYAPSAEEHAKLQAALKPRGVSRQSDFTDPAVQREYAAAIKEAFGTDEAPSQASMTPREFEAVIDRLNGAIDPSRFQVTVPREYEMLDTLHNTVKPAGSDTWVLNHAGVVR